jgi:hypothetical protein
MPPASDPPARRLLHGHLWTVWPTLRDRVRPPAAPPVQRVRIPLIDDRYGAIALTGDLRARPGARDLVLLVHGLGGSTGGGYVHAAARRLAELGFATLAVNLRGADLSGCAFYNVALWEDLAATCASPAAAGYARLFVLGFSMGGHVAIHFAANATDPRLAAVAAICTPLDLHCAQRHIDAAPRAAYRRYVLSGLKAIYAAVAARRPVPSPPRAVRRCRTIHDWDRLVIAPRFGHADPEAFYAACSARLALPRLCVPVRLVLAASDPVVPPEVALPFTAGAAPDLLDVRVAARGGHLYFPADLDLGLPGGRGLLAQVTGAWRAESRQTEARDDDAAAVRAP